MNKQKIKKLFKNKKFVVIFSLVIVCLICLIMLLLILSPNTGKSVYGNRLNGIKDIKFTTNDKNKVIKSLKENEKVTDAKMNVHGKIVNVIFNVKKDTSVDDAKAIGSSVLDNFKDDVKGFYDIEVIITKSDEEKDENGNKAFPIMGYKNSSSEGFVW